MNSMVTEVRRQIKIATWFVAANIWLAMFALRAGISAGTMLAAGVVCVGMVFVLAYAYGRQT